MRKYVLAFLGLALLLSACRIESNIILDINEDGSATVGVEIGFDEEMLNLMSSSGGDPSDILSDLPNLGGDGMEPIQRTEGDMTYFGATTNVDDLSTYDFDGFEGEAFSEFSYEFDDAGATLSAMVDATGVGDFGGGDLPIDPSEITGDIFSARVLVTMPGDVKESNADEVLSDGTLVWNLPFTGTKEILATSSFGGTGFNTIWLVLGGVLIVGAIAAIAAMTMSKKDSEKAVAEAAASYQVSEGEKPSSVIDQPSEEVKPSADHSPPSAEEGPSAQEEPSADEPPSADHRPPSEQDQPESDSEL